MTRDLSPVVISFCCLFTLAVSPVATEYGVGTRDGNFSPSLVIAPYFCQLLSSFLDDRGFLLLLLLSFLPLLR